jgi:ABC-type Fe3+ transport system permease subunit
MYVYFYLLVRAALRSLDGSLLEAAASLGAGRWRTLRLVVSSAASGPGRRGALPS